MSRLWRDRARLTEKKGDLRDRFDDRPKGKSPIHDDGYDDARSWSRSLVDIPARPIWMGWREPLLLLWHGLIVVRFIIESMLSWLLSSNVTTPRYAGISVADAQLAAEAAIHPLETRVQSLELACAGLWHLLKAKHGFTDAELVEAIREVDGMDGAMDGKMRPSVDFVCPSCHRKPLVRKGTACSWCGADLGRSPL